MQQKLKICVFANLNSIHTKRWIEFFLSRDHTVYSILFHEETLPEGYSEMLKKSNFHIIKVPSDAYYKPPLGKIIKILDKITHRKFTTILKIQYLYHIKRKYNFDIVQGHYLVQTGYWAIRMKHHPCVVSAWGSDLSLVRVGSKENIIYKKLFSFVDLIQTHDESGMQQLLELGCPKSKIWVQQRGGVDIDVFHPNNNTQDAKIQNDMPDKICRIICTRTLDEKYNIHTLLKAVNIIKSQNIKFRLLLVGGGKDRLKYEQYVKENNLSDVVFFKGKVPYEKISECYSKADIYVDPYFIDKGGGGRGQSSMEAMASGLPIIAAIRPGIENVVHEGENGFIFHGNNETELAEKLIKCIINDELCKAFGLESRKIALNDADWNVNMERIENKLFEILKKY